VQQVPHVKGWYSGLLMFHNLNTPFLITQLYRSFLSFLWTSRFLLYLGIEAIPNNWVKEIEKSDYLNDLSARLAEKKACVLV
jgi:hypothetical protein